MTDVLDHGYVNLVESWGSDESIISAARMSTNKGFEGWGPHLMGKCSMCGHAQFPASPCDKCGASPAEWERVQVAGDEKLLRYLWEHKHHTPFEMGGACFEVQAPIFVFREWHRHRVPFSYNEASARYAPLPDLNYVPTVERLMMNAKTGNKQAGTIKGAEEMDEAKAFGFQEGLRHCYANQEDFYQKMLVWGVPKELARVHLPVGRYSKMRAASNLRGWLNFLTLRMDKNAQWEIQQFANAVHDALVLKFPYTMALFDEGR